MFNYLLLIKEEDETGEIYRVVSKCRTISEAVKRQLNYENSTIFKEVNWEVRECQKQS